MFAKPISLILVYIVTVFNLVVIFSPFLAFTIPFINFENNSIIVNSSLYQKIKFAVYFIIFLTSFLMLFYLLLDMIFGFSVRASLKNCVRHEKLKDYDFLSGVFDQVKSKFGQKSVRLYVKNSAEINAYAVGSFGTKAVVLTSGLINHYLVQCQDAKKFLYMLRSIMGHEMSHLINKDFLPTFLIIINQKATNFIASFLRIIFSFISRILTFMPYSGKFSAALMIDFYNISSFLLTAFNRFVVYGIYEFLRRFISRNLEYRCDKQSAQAFGGSNMAAALVMLGKSGYFTLFSTHPATTKRIKKVENVKMKDRVINPQFFDSLANYFALMFLVIICLIFAKQAAVDLMVREYLKNHEILHAKLSVLTKILAKLF